MELITNKKKKALYSDFEKADFKFIYVCILIPVLQFAIFWGYVNFDSILLAFQTPKGDFTFQNFKDVWTAFTVEDIYYGFNLFEMLGRSFTLFAIANLIVFPISLCATYVLFRKIWGHYVFRVIYMLPGLIGAVTWVATIKQVTDYNGIVVTLLENLGVEFDFMVNRQGLLASESTAFPTIIAVMFIQGICGGNAVLTGAFARIPEEIYEVGKLDGIGFWTEFFKIAVPCIWPVISMQLTFSLCGIFIAEGNVFLYSNGTGEPGMATIGYYLTYLVYKISLAGGSELPYGYPAALGMVITAVTVPIALGGKWLLEKITEPVEY